MELLDVVKRPIVTEESMSATGEKKYTFEVNTRASEALVKQAVESAFGVKVANVDILNVRPRFKRMGKYTGYTKKRRKTIITLTEGSKEIRLFEATE